MSSTIIYDKKTVLSTLLRSSTDNMSDITRKLNDIIRFKDLKPTDNDPITIVTPRMVRDCRDKNAIPSTLMFREACRIYFKKSNFDELIFTKEELISLITTTIKEYFVKIASYNTFLLDAKSPKTIAKGVNIKASRLTLTQAIYHWSLLKYACNNNCLDIYDLDPDLQTLIQLVVNHLSTPDASQHLLKTFHKLTTQVNSNGLPSQIRLNKYIKPLLHTVLTILWHNSEFEIII